MATIGLDSGGGLKGGLGGYDDSNASSNPGEKPTGIGMPGPGDPGYAYPPAGSGGYGPPTYPAPPVLGNTGPLGTTTNLSGDPYYRATYKTPNDYLQALLTGYGTNAPVAGPQGSNMPGGWSELANEANRIYGLQTGQSVAYDPSRGSQGIFEMPASANGGQGGYFSFDNNQWAFHPTSPEGSGAPSGTDIFSDPATQQYEQLINQMVGKLDTPYTPPDFQSAVDYLKSYFNQLQQPVYSPQQQDLIQTQALDPIIQQRDASNQQIVQRFASQGIPPSSGIVQKALLDNSQNFEKLRTQAQSNFATNEISLGRQNQQQAAALGPQIASIEQALQSGNEQRALQGVNLASIIPSLAWSRLMGANGTIQQSNPFQALQLLNSFQNTGYNQGANLGSGLAQIIGTILGL